MGWLERIFGLEQSEDIQVNPEPQTYEDDNGEESTVPPERMGFNGEYDQSGLAKRVTLAFDEDPDLDDVSTLWVAQTGDTVVLKGSVPNEDILNKMVDVASGVYGAGDVNIDQVTVEG